MTGTDHATIRVPFRLALCPKPFDQIGKVFWIESLPECRRHERDRDCFPGFDLIFPESLGVSREVANLQNIAAFTGDEGAALSSVN